MFVFGVLSCLCCFVDLVYSLDLVWLIVVFSFFVWFALLVIRFGVFVG